VKCAHNINKILVVFNRSGEINPRAVSNEAGCTQELEVRFCRLTLYR